jgi:hypothetical protein
MIGRMRGVGRFLDAPRFGSFETRDAEVSSSEIAGKDGNDEECSKVWLSFRVALLFAAI